MWPLIHLSYCADRGWPCIKKKGGKSTAVPTLAKIRVGGDAQYANSKYIQNLNVDGAAKEERYKVAKEPLELRNKLHTMLKEEQDPSKLDPDILARDLAMRQLEEAPKSRMYYRINARRGLTGGKRLGVKRGGSKTDLMAAQKKEALLKKMHLPDVEKEAKAHHSVFEFAAIHYNVFENENFVSVKVIRRGDTTIDASVFIIDCLPNMNATLVTNRTIPLVDYIREKHPTTPIILVAGTWYGDHWFDPTPNDSKRQALIEKYNELIAKTGDKNLYLIENSKDELFNENPLINPTVGGTHPSDLGHMEITKFYTKYLNDLLKKYE